jgi:pilus assembly protein CpaB
MKKFLPIILAIVAFGVVLFFLRPAPQVKVAIAATDLTVGHMITAEDMQLREISKEFAPADAVVNPSEVAGLTLLENRSQGDILRTSQLGVEAIALQPDERAVAITINNASGLAGLLRPGDRVGVSAIISVRDVEGEGTFSKTTVENLRVLYLSPEFKANDPEDVEVAQQSAAGIVTITNRKEQGVVLLAVPVTSVTIVYDFSRSSPQLETKAKVVNVVELLTALEASDNATLSLYLMPHDPVDMVTSGLWLPELVILPYEPTPVINLESITGIPLEGQP